MTEASDARPVLFTSDVHLTARDPDGIARFESFLAGPARRAAKLLVLGDLFDFWVTPAQRGDAALAGVFSALQALVDAGVDVAFLEGNRDFAVTPELRAIGVRPLGDIEVLPAAGRRIVMTHGDLLCTDDVRYQAFRRFARTRLVRHVLRATPERFALGVGAGARAGSRLETARKAYGSMGLNGRAAVSLLRATGADALICGHVHWGQRFAVDVDGEPRDVIVLSAWEDVPTYARLDASGLAFLQFRAT